MAAFDTSPPSTRLDNNEGLPSELFVFFKEDHPSGHAESKWLQKPWEQSYHVKATTFHSPHICIAAPAANFPIQDRVSRYPASTHHRI
jgi:hypothetical protein